MTIQPVTSDLARSLGLSEVRGALVNAVQAGGPAEKAGVHRGDVITAVNGAAIKDSNDLRNDVAQLPPGSAVKLTVVRDGKEHAINVTLSERKAANAEREEGAAASESGGFGMALEPLTRDRAQELGLSSTAGVIVADVQSGGRAADAGLRPGDVIVEIDRKPVSSPNAVRTALEDGSRPALLLVQRGARTLFLTLERQ